MEKYIRPILIFAISFIVGWILAEVLLNHRPKFTGTPKAELTLVLHGGFNIDSLTNDTTKWVRIYDQNNIRIDTTLTIMDIDSAFKDNRQWHYLKIRLTPLCQ